MQSVSSIAPGGHDAGPDTAQAELLSVRGVAKLLGCSERHAFRLASAGRMPAPRKLGALTRWSRAELQQWIEGGCKPIEGGAA